MRYLIALSVLVAALAAPAAAPAGGWATVELEAMPAGFDAGDTWTARFTVLRHGVTPTDGAEPSVTIVDPRVLADVDVPGSPDRRDGRLRGRRRLPRGRDLDVRDRQRIGGHRHGGLADDDVRPGHDQRSRRRWRCGGRRRPALAGFPGRARPAARARGARDLRRPAPEEAGARGPLSARLSGGTSTVCTV